MDSIKYNAALAISGAERGTSREKLYQELGLNYNLDSKIRNPETFSAFKKSILKFKKPSSNSIFNFQAQFSGCS